MYTINTHFSIPNINPFMNKSDIFPYSYSERILSQRKKSLKKLKNKTERYKYTLQSTNLSLKLKNQKPSDFFLVII